MAKLPVRPDIVRLRRLAPKLLRLPAATTLSRIYFRGGKHPTEWNHFRHVGPLTGSRFDHHPLPASTQPKLYRRYGIIYLAQASGSDVAGLDVGLAEVFQATRVVQRSRHQPCWAVFKTTSALTLLDLRGAWTTKVGASLALSTGPKSSTRNWAKAFYRVYPMIDGLIYPSAMCASGLAIALNDRAANAVPINPLIHYQLNDFKITAILKKAAGRIGYYVMP